MRYSLEGYVNPIGIADRKHGLEQTLPDDVKSRLPWAEDIERELDEVSADDGSTSSESRL